MVHNPAARNRPLAIIGAGQVSPGDLDLRLLKIAWQSSSVAHQETNAPSSGQESPCQFLADESGRPQDENVDGRGQFWYGTFPLIRSATGRSARYLSPSKLSNPGSSGFAVGKNSSLATISEHVLMFVSRFSGDRDNDLPRSPSLLSQEMERDVSLLGQSGRPWGGIVPPSPVLAPGSVLGSRPRVALSSLGSFNLLRSTATG